MLIPAKDFDPTGTAVPWATITKAWDAVSDGKLSELLDN